ncbi:prolyl oligopeptidase family serine peptidase [Candidatus Fermentibacteria bacterium]|nr:prolyl oligopeptidase family serine peptidase [Candidatus Fermentibacteria bacterium]
MRILTWSIGACVVVFATAGTAQQNLQAWHIHGQSFLVWEHTTPTPGDTATYMIYSSPSPITSLQGLPTVERVFATSGANMRLHDLVADARWLIPSATGVLVPVAANSALGVLTPSEAGVAYYAVSAPGSEEFCVFGPVAETVDSVRAYIQYEDEDVTVYGHWIDGRADYSGGRPEYPVMGTPSANGLGFNFAMWTVGNTPPSGDLPLVVALHGYGGGLMSCAPTEPFGFYSAADSALVATLDDALPERLSSAVAEVGTFWFGWNSQFDRFDPALPGPGAVIVDYTARRMWWEIDWLTDHYPVNLDRVSFMGVSMGGFGTLVHSQMRAEQISAALAFVPVFDIGTLSAAPFYLFGNQVQNLPTSLPGSPGFYDVSRQSWRLQNRANDWPYTMIVCGKNDEVVGWEDKPDGYRQLDSATTGFGLYWDERFHADWVGYHWDASAHLHANYLAGFSRVQSFPAFSGADLDFGAQGQQPDPGDGDPQNGDPWGTWGGYLEWDAESIVDMLDEWAVSFWIVTESLYPNDIPAADSLRTSITIRRAQAFEPESGLRWSLTRESDGAIMQDGIAVPNDGVVTVPAIIARKYPQRLTILNGACIDFDVAVPSRLPRITSLHPIPATEALTVAYALPASGQTKLVVMDLLGRSAGVFSSGIQPAGDHTTHLSLSTVDFSLAPGVYALALVQEGHGSASRLVVVR